jgi:CRISPR type III-B/RAMP module-associated protein Cmr5
MEFESIDQKRAQLAWRKIDDVTESKGKYRSLIRGLPAMIQSAGAGQTLAYLQSNKDKKEFELVLDHLNAWLCDARSIPWREKPEKPSEVYEKLLKYSHPGIFIYSGRQGS